MSERDKQILAIALPSIVSNITVPLLGMVDVAVTGHMGSAAFIAAIAVGSMSFNLIYWLCGFLRMSTSGMTAQALGRRDMQALTGHLIRTVTVGFLLGLLFVVAGRPLCRLMLAVMGATADVLPLARAYFRIVIYGAPAVLGLYGLSGWLVGMQNTRLPMVVSVVQNVVNILLSVVLVFGFGCQMEGVATGTLVAQWTGFLLALAFTLRLYRRHLTPVGRRAVFGRTALSRFFTVSRDIFLRTLFLVAVNGCFTSVGARQGAVVLAVNTLLMQLFTLFSYVMDGFAFAGEAMCGRYVGAGNGAAFHDTVSRLFRWGWLLAAAYTVVYVVGGVPFLSLLTSETDVTEASRSYVAWAWLIPLAGMAAFVWDGIYIGITRTRDMLVSSLAASVVFFLLCLTLLPLLGNHGLWLAFIVYLAVRGIVQTWLIRRHPVF